MIYLNVLLTAKDPADAGRVKELLAETARRSRTEPGCTRFEVYHSQADRRTFLLVERWDKCPDALTADARDLETTGCTTLHRPDSYSGMLNCGHAN